jgi:hypothetical protein
LSYAQLGKSLYDTAIAAFETRYTSATDPLTAGDSTALTALRTLVTNVLDSIEDISGYATSDVSAYDTARTAFSGTTLTASTTKASTSFTAGDLTIAVNGAYFPTGYANYNRLVFPEFDAKIAEYYDAVKAITFDGATVLTSNDITSINAARTAFNAAVTDALLAAAAIDALEIHIQQLRDQTLLLEKSDLTTSEWRALIDIILLLDIGNIDKVSLDGSTYKTIAGTIGTDALNTSVKTSLAAAINTAGNVDDLDLDGVAPNQVDFTSTIGTAVLTTSVKTSLVDAINAIATRSDNIITTGLTGFFGCTAGVQDVTIHLPTGTTEGELYDKIAQCIKYSASTNNLGHATVSGGECTDITSRGDALVHCIGSIMTVADYS